MIIKKTETYDERWSGGKGGRGKGEGGADGALQFYSEGFSKGGIPGMNFHVPHMK